MPILTPRMPLISDDLINRIGVLASQRQPPVHDVHDQPFGVCPRPGGVATPRKWSKAHELQRILLRAYVGMNQAVEVHSQNSVMSGTIESGFTVPNPDPTKIMNGIALGLIPDVCEGPRILKGARPISNKTGFYRTT